MIKEEAVKQEKIKMAEPGDAYLMYFDGSYRESHGAASGGVVIYDTKGVLVRKQGLKLDAKSNNEAEYMTFQNRLRMCRQLGIHFLRIRGDALLVVKQVLGVWKNKNPRLRTLCVQVKQLLKRFEAWSIMHIDRSQNEEAHNAAQNMIMEVFVMRANEPWYHGRETLSKKLSSCNQVFCQKISCHKKSMHL